MKVLFICSRNRQRSLTAEHHFADVAGHQVRSAGTEPNARIRVTAGHIGWADRIFVMEKRHLDRLRAKFPEPLRGKPIICLHIPDTYAYLDAALIAHLEQTVGPHLLPTHEVPDDDDLAL
jgi:predicted protein tyrosine phosphatase